MDVSVVTGHLVPDELKDPRTQRLHKTAAGSKGKQAEAEWISFAQAVVRGEIKQLDTRHLKTVNQAINRHIDNLLQKCQFLSAATGATITLVHDPHPGWLDRSNRSGGAHPAAFRPVFGVCTGTGRAEYAVTASSMSRGLSLVREYINDLEQKKQVKKQPMTREAALLKETNHIRAELAGLANHWNELVQRQEAIDAELASLLA